MPWKKCPHCQQLSYSAATNYSTWPCPECGANLAMEPEYESPADLLAAGPARLTLIRGDSGRRRPRHQV
ncbi:MAG: hypothetical protein AB1331_00830 [Bacillota bacterium]